MPESQEKQVEIITKNPKNKELYMYSAGFDKSGLNNFFHFEIASGSLFRSDALNWVF